MSCVEYIICAVFISFSCCEAVFTPVHGQANFINPWNINYGPEPFPTKSAPSDKAFETKLCCLPSGCFDPCPVSVAQGPFQMPYPVLPPIPLSVGPGRAVFERVQHQHPPIEEIKRYLVSKKEKKKHWKKYVDEDDDY